MARLAKYYSQPIAEALWTNRFCLSNTRAHAGSQHKAREWPLSLYLLALAA